MLKYCDMTNKITKSTLFRNLQNFLEIIWKNALCSTIKNPFKNAITHSAFFVQQSN